MKIPKVTLSFAAMVCILAWLNWQICLSFLLSVFVHELGHMLAMKMLKVPLRNMSVYAGGAKIETGEMKYSAEFCCAAAGPLAGALLAVAVGRVWSQTAVVSLFLSVFNLLPMYPLDGGRMVRSALCMYMAEERVHKTMRIITSVTCCLLMICACWAAVCLQMGLWPVFVSLILLCRVGARE